MSTPYASTDFHGLMGTCEMECAVARMLNLARKKGCLFPDIVVHEEDFNNDGFDQDGFRDLIEYGWLRRNEASEKGYRPTAGLVQRVHNRVPNA